MPRLSGKIALVTGGASGLGASAVTLMAREGATVIIGDIEVEAGQQLVEVLTHQGLQVEFLPLDVCEEADWDRVMTQIGERHSALHVLVNNAGIAPEGGMDMSFALWRKVMSINLDGCFLGTRAAIGTMRATGSRGSIINISSTMAMVGEATTAAYSASKGGVRSLTKAAAMYCAGERLPIRVNSVHPGMCVTPLVENFFAAHPEQRAIHAAKYPIGDLGTPDDIAWAIVYLASDESRFMLGAEMVVDGGYLAQG
tara:strand:+ start:5665 stop:6429 length:765 start_codon:yes stop_codon:yes gene_type:complete